MKIKYVANLDGLRKLAAMFAKGKGWEIIWINESKFEGRDEKTGRLLGVCAVAEVKER